jgi:nitrogen fixation protein FixH
VSWKLVIAVVAAAALAAVVGAVWVGTRTFERTVVADPYETGIHHDADRRRARELGWNARVDEGGLRAGPDARLSVVLTGRDGAPLDGAEVTFRVERPGTSRYDRSARAALDGAGRYTATLPMPEPGFWDLDIVVQKGAESLTLGRWIHVGGGTGEGVHCDAGQRTCAAEAGPYRVLLSFSPHPPVPLQEIEATVRLVRDGAPARDAEVSVLLIMPGMYMGENRIALRPSADGSYTGKGALVRCASGRRDWTADVVVRPPGGEEGRARFTFVAAP